ncbi:winged helix-turn-helix domain-containing protein [Thermopolyspora sp. NPDC052614]|uniref:GntR family transcriptional regulator n=1 Tax=Thermopolyspora sp. NPDC052614 TaxID=3155682 RepID=UPI0034498F34
MTATSHTHIHPIDPESDRHVYQQIAHRIRDRIDAGDWQRRLPSVTHLMQEYGVARQTMLRALGHLSELGIIYTVKNRGSFVRSSQVAVVELAPGARAIARPASQAERAELDLTENGWVVVAEQPGRNVEVHPADRVELRAPE